MSGTGIHPRRASGWTNAYVEYVEQPSVPNKFVRDHIPWRLVCFWRWLWFGYVFFPISEWVRWDGLPPCRIARLWRRPADGRA